MPEPQAHPHFRQIRRVALHALLGGVAITLMKFAIFRLTNSAAVLSDAMESIINLVAASFLLYSLWLSNRPADREHPYGHGKVEFMAVGLEGWLILGAGVLIAFEAVRRFIQPPTLDPQALTWGAWLLAGVGVLSGALALYVWWSGRRYDSPPLIADGKHLITDVVSTTGVFVGLLIVRYTGKHWLDPLIALVMAGLILGTSWKLLWQSIGGLMDRTDPADDAMIRGILDQEITEGAIRGYHKVRHRHSGRFHWVEMHLQVNPDLSVRQSHDLASRIEYRVEQGLGEGNATAHVEPFEDASSPPGAGAEPAAEAPPRDNDTRPIAP